MVSELVWLFGVVSSGMDGFVMFDFEFGDGKVER